RTLVRGELLGPDQHHRPVEPLLAELGGRGSPGQVRADDHGGAGHLAILALMPLETAAGRSRFALTVAVGLAAGFLSGLFGIGGGGGIVIVPVLVVAFGVPSVIAKGTSLLVIIPTAISGTFVNRRRGNVDLAVAAIVGLSGAAAAYGGAKLSAHISSELSSILFGALLMVVAVRLLLTRDRDGRGA